MTPKNFKTIPLTHVTHIKTIVSNLPHEAKICCDSFAFDREQMIEVVTWLTQYGETQRVGVKLWFSLYFMQHRQKATKSFPALKLDVVVN